MYAGISFPQISQVAGNNLEGLKYRLVNKTGTLNDVDLAAGNVIGLGVLTNDPRSGEHASVAFLGYTKVQVGTGGLAIGQFFTSAATGFAVGVSSGAATSHLWGRGISPTAVASGSIAHVILYNGTTLTDSGQAL